MPDTRLIDPEWLPLTAVIAHTRISALGCVERHRT